MSGRPLGVQSVKERWRNRRKPSNWRMFYAMSALSAITNHSLPRPVGWLKTGIIQSFSFAKPLNTHIWNSCSALITNGIFLSFLKMTFHWYWCWTYIKRIYIFSLNFTWQCCYLKKYVYLGPHTHTDVYTCVYISLFLAILGIKFTNMLTLVRRKQIQFA